MRLAFVLLFFIMQTIQCTIIEVTHSQNVTAQNGDTIVIKLKENPTTGYSWEMNISNIDIVKLIENTYVTPNTNLVGAGGERKYILKAKKSGKTKIAGKYRRSWEPISSQQDFECVITVK